MKQFWTAIAELADALCLVVGRSVLFVAGVITLIYLACGLLDAVGDYRRGRATSKGARR